ncbi:hypothetical protein N7520_002221 [Penicillium odoratum]|uniref:uncharacterized protein n=1 Tax=Penicillium odoratum TaxID=1167516 RepID=UPI0025490078|nr:uncharacterized protein N7520_002221 [Penicillium odoratum]KAJ5771692.1 hypothetical protein N7520_002221 [Penicillium odoratum]
MNADNLYGYDPSIAAALIFVILFAGTTSYHIWQLTKAQCWYFIPFVIGGIFQIIGYVSRIIAHNNLSSVTIYAIQTIMILLAPTLYAASVYMILGRLVRYLHAEKLSLVPVKWMTKIFVAGDVFSFLLQSAGGGMMAGETTRTLGSNVVIIGLVVQLLFFGFFVVVTITFHIRINKYPTTRSLAERQMARNEVWGQHNWSTAIMALYAVSMLILIRSVYRLVEYKEGYSGVIMTHEAYAYVLDATLMWLAMVVMNIWHPANILGDAKSEKIPDDYDMSH